MAITLAFLEELIEPVVQSMGLELWGIEFSPAGRRHGAVLRIFIDSADGIGIDDCERVSRQVSSVMDVEDPIATEYRLEVSSPGLDRPLFKLAHYDAFKGQKVKVKLLALFEGRRNFTGIIKGVEDNDVVLVVDEHEYLLPIDTIGKGSIVPNFEFGKDKHKI